MIHDPCPSWSEQHLRELARAIEVYESCGEHEFEPWSQAHPDDDPALASRVRALREAQLQTRPGADGAGALERIGGYRVLHRLGEGATGIVLLALDEPRGRLVALKVLAPHVGRRERLRERFRREARAIARLQHPGIVPLLETGEDRGQPYQVLEYVEGLTLEDGLERLRMLVACAADVSTHEITEAWCLPHGAPIPADLARAAGQWGGEIALALAHAHAHGVVHRDVKPSNVMIDAAGRARLLDFGLARSSADLRITWSADLLGTPQYMAPEVISKGIGATDERVDLFALGACMYEIATLCSPFEGRTSLKVLQAVLECDPLPPSRLNPRAAPEFDAICALALAKDPGRRYRSARDLAEDLDALRVGRAPRGSGKGLELQLPRIGDTRFAAKLRRWLAGLG
jgi:eukaryotic-like serine/threonine-protein kinase